MVEIPLDLDADEPTFEIGRRIDVEPLLADTGYDYPSSSPVCHQYDGEGRAWVTLGPGIEHGGLFVFDTDDAEVVHAYDPTEVRANCGIGFTDDHTRAVANWSGIFGADVDDEEGEWYVFDTDTFEVIGEIDTGDTPDILDFSPDGRYAYITQRGPSPLSGDPHVAVGSEAGLLVVDVESGEHVTFLATPEVPDGDGEVVNDVHGVGVRTTTGDERVVSAAPATGVIATAFSCHRPA